MVTLRFDPRMAPHATAPAHVEVHNENTAMDVITDIFQLRQAVMQKFTTQKDSVERAGKSVSLFRDDYDWHAAQIPLKERLATESKPFCRQALLISLFSSGRMDARDSTLAKQLLAEVSPESRFWSVYPAGTIGNLRQSLSAKGVEPYLAGVIERSPDPAVRAAFLLEALMEAKAEGVGKAKAAYYYELLTTKYSGSTEAAFARQGLAPTKRIQVGQNLPEFKFIDLRDSTRYLTNTSFEGKILLLDFWATWCKPCVAEIPGIHRAYDKYHQQGLEILSVSLDETPSALHGFLRTRDSMPWHLVFAPVPERSALMEAFEFNGIPRPLLVDKHGKIIAMDDDLRGEGLDKNLQKVIEASKR
jgi:thiol-disulfide isomerase/thioredoxin